MNYKKQRILDALKSAWSPESAKQWTADTPAAGQCNVTALLVNELFGGEILSTPVPEGLHFYNEIGGEPVDFTASQFQQPIDYEHRPAGRNDLYSGIAPGEYEALKTRFLHEYDDTRPN